jgi:hypothetical protein
MGSTSEPTEYVHPTFVMAHIVNPVLKAIGSPTLTVRGRRSGLSISTRRRREDECKNVCNRPDSYTEHAI